MNFSKLLTGQFPIISDQIKRPALEVVLDQLEKILQADVPGDIVEFGCYIGTTSLFLRRMLDKYAGDSALDPAAKSTRQLHAYDSFEGLPLKAKPDQSPVGADFQAGELSVSKKQLLHEFYKARLQAPIVHKGWFGELTENDVPSHIAFAFLDGDFYESIFDSLRLVWPRMSSGGTICIDDFGREALPGVERAVRDYFGGKPPQVRMTHGIGIIPRFA